MCVQFPGVVVVQVVLSKLLNIIVWIEKETYLSRVLGPINPGVVWESQPPHWALMDRAQPSLTWPPSKYEHILPLSTLWAKVKPMHCIALNATICQYFMATLKMYVNVSCHHGHPPNMNILPMSSGIPIPKIIWQIFAIINDNSAKNFREKIQMVFDPPPPPRHLRTLRGVFYR